MTRFHIIANSIKDPNGAYTAEIESVLRELGATEVSTGSDIPKDTDIILVLGGDGTMLRAAGDSFGCNIPLLGVNLGTLGYLAEAEMANIKDDLALLFEEEPAIEERMMLCGTIVDRDREIASDHCLNEVSIVGNGALCIVRYELYVNGEFLNSYAADGLVISTPTGSTGYNMSAGGPIVNPKASLIVITPICPHTLNTRSIVLSAEDEIVVKLLPDQSIPVAIQFDGREPYYMNNGGEVRISKSDQVTRIVKLHKESFLRTLHKKLV